MEIRNHARHDGAAEADSHELPHAIARLGRHIAASRIEVLRREAGKEPGPFVARSSNSSAAAGLAPVQSHAFRIIRSGRSWGMLVVHLPGQGCAKREAKALRLMARAIGAAMTSANAAVLEDRVEWTSSGDTS